jgi:hypothetical protein
VLVFKVGNLQFTVGNCLPNVLSFADCRLPIAYLIEKILTLWTETNECPSIKSVFVPECSRSRLAKSKKAEFTGVNEHFFDKRNEEIAHYGQTLINCYLPIHYRPIYGTDIKIKTDNLL